jgi:N-acetylglucosamine repressor
LGIGIIIEGELYRGASFCAGELFPHLPTLKEILASVRCRFIEGKILKNYISSPELIDIEVLLEAAKQGDEIAVLAIAKIGDMVGQTIAPAIALLNPDSLIITGVVAGLEDVLVESVKKAIDMKVLSVTSSALTITVDRHHHYSVAVGAAALILENYFRLPV